jgi:hypothetical protein
MQDLFASSLGRVKENGVDYNSTSPDAAPATPGMINRPKLECRRLMALEDS